VPASNQVALLLPCCTPTAYGLGKSGWVSAKFEGMSASEIDVEMLKAWLDESYRAQAPRGLVKQLGASVEAKPAAVVKVKATATAAKRKPEAKPAKPTKRARS